MINRSLGKPLWISYNVGSISGSLLPLDSGLNQLTKDLKVGILSVDCKLSDWKLQTPCSVDCGGGVEVNYFS